MKQWAHDLIHLASTMPSTPDPDFNETLNFLRLVHNGQWDQLNALDWSALDTTTVFSLAVNVLKPEALLSTPFDWLTPQKGTSPLARLLTGKMLNPFIAQEHEASHSRALYIAQKFWEDAAVQKAFPATTKVVVGQRTRSLGDVAVEWNAPSAVHFLNRTWDTQEEKTDTFAAFFKMICATPLPSFSQHSTGNEFERAGEMFDLLPQGNPFGSSKVNVALLQMAFKAIMSVANHKLEEQAAHRTSLDRKPMAIEMEEFTLSVSQYIAQTLVANPHLWSDVFDTVQSNPLAARVVTGMLFQNISEMDRQHAVDALVNKVVESDEVMWAKIIPTHPAIAVPLSDEHIKSVIAVCSDYYTIKWVCSTLPPLVSTGSQEKLKDIQQLNEKKNERNCPAHEKERIALEMTALIASFGNNQGPKIRKM